MTSKTQMKINSRRHYLKNKAKTIQRKKDCKDRNRAFIIKYLKEHPCVDCGEPNIIVLEFDHLDPSTKEMCVTEGIRRGWSFKKIQKEIDKCEVVCANCHKIRTYTRCNSYRVAP